MAEDQVAAWERVQTKTFTNWVNSHLVKRGQKITSCLTDFQDGVPLINLLEIISEESVGKYSKDPKMRIHKIENVGKALKFIEAHDVKLASIGPEAICDGDVKRTLGMIWTVILRFAIAGLSEEGLSAKEGLLLWCRKKTEPYDNVDVKDFTMSFQDGLAMCALIHRHRPDLLDYHSLKAENDEDKLHNLNLAFDVAKEHLDVARLLDAEDIVGMPRPDERSIMTYVAQLYQVFSKLDKVETAGRRIGKFTDFSKSVAELQHDYETRSRALKNGVVSKASSLPSEPLGDDYEGARGAIGDFASYRKGQRRQWVAEQADLGALLGNIQAKLKSNKLPPYSPPADLTPAEIDNAFDSLYSAEVDRRTALNQNLRQILDTLRKAFAELANPFHEQLASIRGQLSSNAEGSLEEQLAALRATADELSALGNGLGDIEAVEARCLAANIEENEHSDHTYDDLHFEHGRLVSVFKKKISFLENQIAAQQKDDISPEQIKEFKETFGHFDQDGSGKLSRLEFKSCLSSLGVVELDFEGGDKRFDAIFKQIGGGAEDITFDQFVNYMVSITKDETSPSQIRDSFETLAGGKDHITVSDMKIGQMTPEQIAHLTSTLPPKAGIADAYDYRAWLDSLW